MLTIREFKSGDLEQVKKVAINAFADENVSFDYSAEKLFGKIGGTSWKQRKAEDVKNEVRNNPEGTVVAVIDGKVAGFATTSINKYSSVGRIINLGVDRKHHGKGIGKELIKKVLEYFKNKKVKFAKIETLATNKVGSNFYPKMGFKEITRQIHYLMKL
ncbi:MAG: GNAT family N-acetyltransferase [Elusimicrobiota bacterium]|nr:GNAT family N-acetyltransferase [Elusimicrobiota bacterium]